MFDVSRSVYHRFLSPMSVTGDKGRSHTLHMPVHVCGMTLCMGCPRVIMVKEPLYESWQTLEPPSPPICFDYHSGLASTNIILWSCIFRPTIQPEKYGLELGVVLKWRDIYIENIRVVSLIRWLILKWRELLNGWVLNCCDYCTWYSSDKLNLVLNMLNVMLHEY